MDWYNTAIPNSKSIEIVLDGLPSSPNPFSQLGEKGSRKKKRSFLLPLPNLGEGWGEGKPMSHSHLSSEFGIARYNKISPTF
jgi:hypothetical protein